MRSEVEGKRGGLIGLICNFTRDELPDMVEEM